LALVEARAEDHFRALAEAAVARIDPAVEIVLVTTRPLDPADPAVLDRLGKDGAFHGLLRRLRVIDTSGDALARYFSL
jgi:hypothetical protein